MSLHPYSSPEEVIKHYDYINPSHSLRGHILRFYPEFDPSELTQLQLEKALRILSTKAMEIL